jgi:hypothetical protein
MVAVLAALKDPSDGVAAAAGVAAGVVVGVVAGASAGTSATAVQAPLFNSNLSLQDAICEFPGQVHVTAAFAIASHAVHLAASELSSKPVLHMPTAELVAEVQVIEPAFAIAVQAVHLSPSLKNPALHVNAVAAVSSVHVYMALASGAAAAVIILQELHVQQQQPKPILPMQYVLHVLLALRKLRVIAAVMLELLKMPIVLHVLRVPQLLVQLLTPCIHVQMPPLQQNSHVKLGSLKMVINVLLVPQ